MLLLEILLLGIVVSYVLAVHSASRIACLCLMTFVMYMLGAAQLCCVASSHVFDLQQGFQLYSFYADICIVEKGYK